MNPFAAFSMLTVTAVTLGVGARLLRVAARTRQLPELAYGVAFLSGGIGTAGNQLGQRFVWDTPGAFATGMGTACFSLVVLGNAMVLVAVWRIFRPDRRWAAALCVVASIVSVLVLGLRIGSGEIARNEIDTPAMAVFLLLRVFAFAWSGWEALRYHAMLRRRLALGLADPVGVNQILLWGLSGAAMTVVIGTIVVSLFGLGRHPLEIPSATAVMTLLSLVTSAAMWCAFFPPTALRRRLEARAPSA